uniref:Peptidase C19 ubiquitin carboxyl-terminal hydrolase domain-containing protein n=1 Tax=Musca domestica TaxID=7370 RepID=A0A1I8NIV1_MUSDO
MASPMSPTNIYRQTGGPQTGPPHPSTMPHGYGPQQQTPLRHHFPTTGTVQNVNERTRLIELLRAPNILTSPTIEPSSKGLLNGPGQNNCFLNCAVQVSLKFFSSSFPWEIVYPVTSSVSGFPSFV